MAQTPTRLLIHVIFSTTHRHNLITPAIEPELYAYFGAVCCTVESPWLTVGGTENHVHLLISQSKKWALSDLIMTIKKDSSKWIKTKWREFAGFRLANHG